MLALAAGVCFVPGCSKRKLKLTIGGKAGTEQAVLVEILAQLLEARTGEEVMRRTGFTSLPILHQALLMNEIDLYADNVTALAANVLKEKPDRDPSIVLERTRGELNRMARLQLYGPIGLETPYVIVVRADDAKRLNVTTISEAAAVKEGWSFASTSDFMGRIDGNTALQSDYSIRLSGVPRSETPQECYRLLKEKAIGMVAGVATDAALADPDMLVLKDDKGTFAGSQVCVVTRAETAQDLPTLKEILGELRGKLSTDVLRRLDYEAEYRGRDPKELAASFHAGSFK